MPVFDLAAIGAGLAFSAHVEELSAHLTQGIAVVQAPPGSGKTTLAPPVVANHLAGGGRVVVTGPRRMSVRAAAQRLAQLDRSRLGERVGYTIRGERRGGDDLAVEFLTPGVLVRRLLGDAELAGTGAVILDEVHERSLDSDLLLGMLLDLRELRPELILVAMSATLDGSAVADLMGGAPVLTSRGDQHPVTVTYAPPSGPRISGQGVEPSFLKHIARTTAAALGESEDDVLVFLPGRREIDVVADALAGADGGVEVLKLYSGAQDQQRILAGRRAGEPRRVVLATSVAESALTVPGVHTVIDSGLAREPRRDSRRNMTGLVTVTASQASSIQRAGRAGRLGPGRAIRCVDEAGFAAAPKSSRPEILTTDLTGAALMLAVWGTPRAGELRLLDPPPASALTAAHAELVRLELVDEDLRPTAAGTKVARLPVDPRLGRALLASAPVLGREQAADIVALLATDARAQGADLAHLLGELRTGAHPVSSRWRRESGRLARLLPAGAPTADGASLARSARIGFVAALAAGRLARWDGTSYLLTSGTRASLPAGSPLQGEEWLVITDVARTGSAQARGTGALIRAAAPLSGDLPARLLPVSSGRDLSVTGGRVVARVERRIGAIVLSSTPTAPTAAEAAATITAHVRDHGLNTLSWSQAATMLRSRLAAAHEHLGEPWPDVSDRALSEDLQWLSVHVTNPVMDQVPLVQALRTLAGRQLHELDAVAPEQITVPSGRRVDVRYPAPGSGGRITAGVKLQECFGWNTSPRLLRGAVPVTLELLSPAGRPLAITQDLEFFWREVYPEVRAENRARYAKHPWPLDPWAHPATAATSAQLRRRQSS